MASLPRGKSCSNKDHVTPKECCALTIAALNTHLAIPTRGKSEQKEIFQTLVGMASIGQSIHSISQYIRGGVCGTSLRHHLRKLEIEDLGRANTAIPAFYIDQVLKRGESYQFAIDYTHDPYYGTTTSTNEDYVIHSKRKKSTKDFYSYIPLYVITKDRQSGYDLIIG